MKKKLYLDLIMFIIMLLLMQYSLTGNLLHEILGLIVFGLFIIHNVFNLKWIVNMTKKIHTIVDTKIKYQYYLSMILWILLIITIVSGIFISQSIFKLNLTDWYIVHKISSYGLLGIILIHAFVHTDMISKYLSKKLNVNPNVIKSFYIIILIASFIISFKNLLFKHNDEIQSTSSNNSSSNSNSSDNSGSGTTPTLTEYLSTKNCGGCHNHCVLTALRCGKGTAYKEEATTEYYQLYGESTTTSVSDNSDLSYEVDGIIYTLENI